MAFTPDEFDSNQSLNELSDLSFDMSKFINEVFDKEYILVVGSEVILDPKVEPTGDVNNYLLKIINHRLHSNYSNFEDLYIHSNEKIDPIRNLLSKDEFKKSMVIADISKELRDLLETKLFKVVITTTFDSYLELLLKDIWDKEEEQLNIVNIWDATSLSRFQEILNKYNDPKDYNEPTLIYAFGKCEKDEAKKYARNDFDYIQTIERWLSFDARSDKMMQFIQSKRLLSLGCKFDDWYFRFFWYILKREKDKQREGEIAIFFDEEDRSERNLKKYLFNSRVVTYPEKVSGGTDMEKSHTLKFMRDIHTALTSLEDNNPYRDLVVGLRRRGIIFFSYCNRDKQKAREIFNKLQPLFPNLWYDDQKLLGGRNYETEIQMGIENAKVFILLLTPSVAKDLINGDLNHFYNSEWRWACERKQHLAIIPLAVPEVDPREEYYCKTFENFMGDKMSCIEMSEPDWMAKLQRAIDESLKN